MHIIKNIHITQFRAFNNVDIPTDRNIVAIAGQNGTHKTTLLGMLAQSVTLTKKPLNAGRTIDGEFFKTDMREKFKFSEKHDKIGGHAWTVNIDSTIDERGEFSIRSYPRNDDDTPFFLRFWNDDNSRRKGTGFPQCPAIFLSLKRLHPLGEMHDLNDVELQLSTEDGEFYKKWHNQILILLDDINTIHSLSEKGVKTSIGPATEVSDATTISAGQDNIGKIIQAVLSFRRLKKNYPEEYKGGLVFIDEIESTLYPASQIRLLKFMLKMAKELNLQFFFTTHSLTILEYMTSEEAAKIDELALVYLKKHGSNIIAPPNPTWDGILKDLTLNVEEKSVGNRVEVFAEDDVTFDFLDVLLPSRIMRLVARQRQCTLGFSEYAKLQKQRIHEFITNIIVLDGDAFRGPRKLKDSDIKKYKNWVALPGNSFPEHGLYDFLWSLREDPDTWDSVLGGFSSQMCFKNQTTVTDDKNLIKQWYQSIPTKQRKLLVRKYFLKHKDEAQKFLLDFVSAYNHVARLHGLPEILIDGKKSWLLWQ